VSTTGQPPRGPVERHSPRGLVAIGLGANLGSHRLGPPAATLAWAGERLATLLPGLRLAPLYRTAPISHLAQPDFLNTVALAEQPSCAPRRLLAELKAIEQDAGRSAPAERDAPRVLDLDLLFFGDLELDEPGLVLPHPRLRGRLFVLAPLRDLAPELALPPDGLTIAELYRAIAGTQRIELA
jgi:2-amino-4-hydroxy-6-hydroxymethyldihydropteridine diphosphokinase